MPIRPPTIDERRFPEILEQMLKRIPIHNPEWTNFNKSDPGVTILEVSAFMIESLLFRANQIPENSRRKFLSLLGIKPQPGAPSRGIVAFSLKRSASEVLTLNAGVEVRAKQVAFRTERGLDVLPIELRTYYKRQIVGEDEQRLKDYYSYLYSPELPVAPADILLYETTPFMGPQVALDLDDTIDKSLWLALLIRDSDVPKPNQSPPIAVVRQSLQALLRGKTLTLGIAMSHDEPSRLLSPVGSAAPSSAELRFYTPNVNEPLASNPSERVAKYQQLLSQTSGDLLREPGTVDINLPSDRIDTWADLSELEVGTRNFPPALADDRLAERVITWLRLAPSAALSGKVLWVGLNAACITQRNRVLAERLLDGSGDPDQLRTLANRPLVPGSLRLSVVTTDGNQEIRELWSEIDDLFAAGPEVPVPDLRLPPGTAAPPVRMNKVYMVDHEAGQLRFGDGMHGVRVPRGARLYADYDFFDGGRGNVGPGSVDVIQGIPDAGSPPTQALTVENQLNTWGGVDPETVTEAEKQIARTLQHQDRLVTAADFEALALRTPGVEIARVEVLAAYNPDLGRSVPGDVAGAVTLMVIPKYDPEHPDAPQPSDAFLNAVACWLEPRRVLTTEIFLRRPSYKRIVVSIGVELVAGFAPAVVREAIGQAVRRFLSPLPSPQAQGLAETSTILPAQDSVRRDGGWPLRKAVDVREIQAVVSRVDGVSLVRGVELALEREAKRTTLELQGLELPQLGTLAVTIGDAIPVAELRARGGSGLSDTGASGDGTAERRVPVPVPVIPQECQ